VADFIGDVNLIKGRAKARDPVEGDDTSGGLELHWGEGHAPLVAANGDTALADKEVVLALRPEKMSISKEHPAAANALKGKVIDIGYLGNISTYHVELDNGTMVKAQIANTRRVSRRQITWEDEVWLSFSATAAIVLEG
jgi:ABC-type Fe3+/spermidine/putrescine transport system ATPase subunit